MKADTAAKLRQAEPAELANQLTEANEQMFRLKMKMSLGQMEGLGNYRKLRKEKARLLTVQRERDLAKK